MRRSRTCRRAKSWQQTSQQRPVAIHFPTATIAGHRRRRWWHLLLDCCWRVPQRILGASNLRSLWGASPDRPTALRRKLWHAARGVGRHRPQPGVDTAHNLELRERTGKDVVRSMASKMLEAPLPTGLVDSARAFLDNKQQSVTDIPEDEVWKRNIVRFAPNVRLG